MITKRSTKAQLLKELDRLKAAEIQANRKRAEEFERWALRCRELKAKNEELTKELEWLRDQPRASPFGA